MCSSTQRVGNFIRAYQNVTQVAKAFTPEYTDSVKPLSSKGVLPQPIQCLLTIVMYHIKTIG